MQGSAKPWYGLGPWGRHRLPVFAASCAVLGACAAKSPPPEAPAPAQEPVAVAPVVEVDTIVVTDPELEQQIAGLQLRILEKDARSRSCKSGSKKRGRRLCGPWPSSRAWRLGRRQPRASPRRK